MKNYLIKIINITMIALLTTNSMAEIPERLPITPQAPNVSSLGYFGKFAFGHHTGTPDVNIPLYEIDLDGMKIPIQLKYNASGIKVAQEASWVGLGWSLQVGGTIVKEIRGWNDFGDNDTRESAPDGDFDLGYYLNNFRVWPKRDRNDEVSTVGSEDEQFYISNRLPKFDTQPDMFHFNFGSYSGSMYFDRNDNPKTNWAKPLIQSPDSYLDITYDIRSKSWKIIDPSGYKFYFGSTDLSEVHNDYLSVFSELHSKDKKMIPQRKKMGRTENTWYPDSIVSPKGNKISFEYEYEHFSTPINIHEGIALNEETGYNFSNNLGFSYSYSVHRQIVLKRIIFNAGKILFETSERKDLDSKQYGNSDLERGEPLLPQKLDRLLVKNELGHTIKEYSLGYSYMGTLDYLNCRLMLDAVTEKGDNSNSRPYQFSYFPGVLSEKNSLTKKDTWGYNTEERILYDFNGKNFKALPAIMKLGRDSHNNIMNYDLIGGTNNIPNLESTRIGTLSKIQYPTGGETEFTYELHELNEFSYYYNQKMEILENTYHNPDSGRIRDQLEFSDRFFLENETYVEVLLNYRYNTVPGQTPPSSYPDNSIAFGLYQISANGKSEKIRDGVFLIQGAGGYNGDGVYLKLEPGEYVLKIQKDVIPGTSNPKPNNYVFQMEVNLLEETVITSGGGLRVKEMRNKDRDKTLSKTRYKYRYFKEWEKEEISSGIMIKHSGFAQAQTYKEIIFNFVEFLNLGDGPPSSGKTPRYWTPYLSIDNSPTGDIRYFYVEEENVDATGNTCGKTSYEFFASQVIEKESIPGYPDFPDPRNGFLLEKKVYDRDKRLLQTLNREYSWDQNLYNRTPVEGLILYTPKDRSLLGSKFYDLKQERWMLNNETSMEYFYNDNKKDSIIVKTNYTYDPIYWTLTKTESTNSRNQKIENRIQYAPNFSDAINVDMTNRNMVGIPIEQITLVNNLVSSAEKVTYKNVNEMYLPDFVQKLGIESPVSLSSFSQYYTDEFRYDKYDKSGNVVQLTGQDNNPVVYLWGYNHQYPIAEIKGAVYNDVKTALGYSQDSQMEDLFSQTNPDVDNIGKKLRTHFSDESFRDKPVMVTTYSYKPLVGITSMTNPAGVKTNYVYDSLGRLETILDKDNNILEHHIYKYKNNN